VDVEKKDEQKKRTKKEGKKTMTYKRVQNTPTLGKGRQTGGKEGEPFSRQYKQFWADRSSGGKFGTNTGEKKRQLGKEGY